MQMTPLNFMEWTWGAGIESCGNTICRDSRDFTPTEYQDSSKTLDCSSLQFLCKWQNLTLLTTSQEAEGRIDYQQTDTTSISTKLA
jgi:hypothetical protein